MKTQTLVGTAKGAFVFTSTDRQSWQIEGPLFKGWKVTAAHRTESGTFLAATASDIYGCAVHRSNDLRSWRQVEQGPRYDAESGHKLNQVWTLASQHGRVFAGVDQAGLFRSDDDGVSWTAVSGLNDHETRSKWFPGAGGLCAHVILTHPDNPEQLWCGISAVGVFRSDDGGATWQPRNRGVQCVAEDDTVPDIGYCVHGLAQDPTDPLTIYRQDHRGMYRTRDGGDHWERNETGLPSRFGFPIAIDRSSGTLFSVPLESDEYRLPIDGALRVFRSQDRGETWHAVTEGLPQRHAYVAVLRGAMAIDHLDPCGVAFGTTGGDVFLSADGGSSWRRQDCQLPRVLCVETFVD